MKTVYHNKSSVGEWPSGKASDFDSVTLGSIPSSPAKSLLSAMDTYGLIHIADDINGYYLLFYYTVTVLHLEVDLL